MISGITIQQILNEHKIDPKSIPNVIEILIGAETVVMYRSSPD